MAEKSASNTVSMDDLQGSSQDLSQVPLPDVLTRQFSALSARASRPSVGVFLGAFLQRITKRAAPRSQLWHNSVEIGLPLAGPLFAFLLMALIAW